MFFQMIFHFYDVCLKNLIFLDLKHVLNRQIWFTKIELPHFGRRITFWFKYMTLALNPFKQDAGSLSTKKYQ